ncbi:MAG: HEAT repeat domain-containing protein [Dehalococcoidia bacterium]|nr:HEAT repeat domain-containing protein [Dehalococcoidia bacterium]
MTAQISDLISKLGSKDGLVRQNARLSIQQIGRAAVPDLSELLSDKRKYVRWEAAKALAEIASPLSARVLVMALEDKDFDVRWLSAIGLIKLGWPALEPALQAILLSEEPDWLWDGVRHVVRGMAKGEITEMLTPLIDAFDSVDYRIKVPMEAKNLLAELRALPQYEYL